MPKPKCTSSSNDGINKRRIRRQNSAQKKILLLSQHEGKHILIKAVDIYSSRKKVPAGEEVVGCLVLYFILI
jgi:hypothetical protein